MTITKKYIYRLVEDDNPSNKYSSIKQNARVVAVTLLFVALIFLFYCFWTQNILAWQTNKQTLYKQLHNVTDDELDHGNFQMDVVTAAIKYVAFGTDESKKVTTIATNPVENLQVDVDTAESEQVQDTTISTDQALNHKICSHNLIPGLERMKRGIDITTLDLFPEQQLLHSSNGFQRPLFEFTCDLDHTWLHPKFSKNLYTFPDQITAINLLPSGGENSDTKFYSNLQDYKRTFAASLSYGVTVGFTISGTLEFSGGFSASAGYKDTMKQILKSNKSVAEVSTYVGAFQVDFLSSSKMRLSEEAREYIQTKLPITYEEDADVYDEFVNKFGAHYFESAIFGGCLYQKTLIDNEYVYNSNEGEIETNLQATLSLNIVPYFKAEGKIDQKNSGGTNKVSEQFLEHSQTSVKYYGGYSDFSIKGTGQNEFVSHWMDTVIENPWLFSGKLVPIERLIGESNIRNQVRKASKIKRTRAYVNDIRNVLDMMTAKLSTTQMETLDTIESYLDAKHATKNSSKMSSFVTQIDQLFESLQQMRDRALLDEYSDKLKDTETILNCKLQKRIHRTMFKQNLDHNAAQALIREIAKIVGFHSTAFNICKLNDDKCKMCFDETLKKSVFCLNPKVKTVVQH